MVGQGIEERPGCDREPVGSTTRLRRRRRSDLAPWSGWPASTRPDGLTAALRPSPERLPPRTRNKPTPIPAPSSSTTSTPTCRSTCTSLLPTGDMWPATSVNTRLPSVPMLKKDGTPVKDAKGKPRRRRPSVWLDKYRPVEQMTWAPGEPLAIDGRLIAEGGWIERPGVTTFNLYRPPVVQQGNAANVDRWLELVERLYSGDVEHIVRFCAHRIQYPAVKINHGLILSGAPGIGKDTILEPLKLGVGAWNFKEVSPQDIMGPHNDYMRCVVLRISEVRDLGEVNRYAFYEHMKINPGDAARRDAGQRQVHSATLRRERSGRDPDDEPPL